MAKFNPNENAPGTSGGKWLDTSGLFLVVFVALVERGKSRNGKPFVKLRGEVIVGEPSGNEGKKWTERIFLNEEAWTRLGAMTRAMGLDKEFELDDDRELREALLGRPFKAKMKTTTSDRGGVFAEIAFSEPDTTDEEGLVIDRWIEEHESSGWYEKIHDRELGNGGREDGDPGPGDDDIPF